MNEILYKNKCSSCECWTIHRANLDASPIENECTACKNNSYISSSPTDFKKIVTLNKKHTKVLETVFPQLKELRNPGDSVNLQD